MVNDTDLVRAIERAPLRTVRLRDLARFGTNPWRALDRLAEQGAVKRLAQGIYTVPPDGRDGRTWKLGLEDAAIAIATARFANRQVAMTGLTAARHWAAIPRAIGVATIAVPRAGHDPVHLYGGGVLRFIPRDLGRLDLILDRTALGDALITTPAQTLFDLLIRPAQGGLPDQAAAAAQNLMPRVTAGELEEVAQGKRVNDAVREMLRRLKERND